VYICQRNNNKQKDTMRTLTQEQATRVQREIETTKNLLSKEMQISLDLRYTDKVNFYNNHILKLENMLVTKQW
jgi:ribosomal protein S13